MINLFLSFFNRMTTKLFRTPRRVCRDSGGVAWDVRLSRRVNDDDLFWSVHTRLWLGSLWTQQLAGLSLTYL